MGNRLKPVFAEVSSALKDLHKDLLMLEAKRLEAERGNKLSPYELLNASLNDASMTWLRRMSELIVSIDTLIDETDHLSAQESHRVSDEVLGILEKPAGSGPSEFWTQYSQYLSTNADIIVRHSQVKNALDKLRPRM